MSRFAFLLPIFAVACEGELTVISAPQPQPWALDAAVASADSGESPAAAAARPTPATEPASTPPVVVTTTTPAAPQGFVMHEWGTFTSVQGSDGSSQDGMQHEEEALPKFVYGRAPLAMHQKQIEGLPEGCNQKMETPVVYFYTAKPLEVTLDVIFKQGIISQWFPSGTAMAPPVGALGSNLSNSTSGLNNGSLQWKVQVDPAIDMAKAPQVPADSIWQPSRNTKATPLRFVGLDHEQQPVDQTERFLFYRGLGRFTLPVQVLAGEKALLTVRNSSGDSLPFGLLLRATTDGKGGLVDLGAIGAQTDRQTYIPSADVPLATAVEQAKAKLKTALVASGLYADEAQGMVDTWQKSWFTTPGVRLLYVLPQPWTVKLLPMQIAPAPTQVVRTLVGRIEVLTIEDEAAAKAIVVQTKASTKFEQAMQLDRFMEPRLHRACQLLDKATYKAHCDKLLKWAANQGN